MRPHHLALAALILLAPLAARAQEASADARWTAQYAAYAHGLHTADITTDVALTASGYAFRLRVRTTGLVDIFVRSQLDSNAEGYWQGLRASPMRFESAGRAGGQAWHTLIEYRDATPLLRILQPTVDEPRDPVPAALLDGAIDNLSAIATLLRLVRQSGACEAAMTTFNGRIVLGFSVHGAGMQPLAAAPHSPYAGPALRCDFTGLERAGFRRGASTQSRQRPRRGSAWFAPVAAGGTGGALPPLPIRMRFDTAWVGYVTLYLQSLTRH
jgi:hypothetical protein